MNNKTPPTWRTELMRKMAAVRTEIDRIDWRTELRAGDAERREELERQLAELWWQFL